MLEIIRDEIDKSESLKSLKLNPTDISRILSLPTQQKVEHTYKLPLNGVYFLSDLEQDQKYDRWPNSLGILNQPSYPGQMKYARKNFLTSIFIFDPSSISSLAMVAGMRNSIADGNFIFFFSIVFNFYIFKKKVFLSSLVSFLLLTKINPTMNCQRK